MTIRPSLLFLFAVCALALTPACDSDSDHHVTPQPDPAPVWSELDNLPSAITLYDLWTPADNLVIGVGPKGIIWLWDGQHWAQMPNLDANDLYAIDGGAAVVAVGDDGTVLEQSGQSFVPEPSVTASDLRAVWSSASGLVVAAGTEGTIIRRSGGTWTVDPRPARDALFGLWGASDTDIFAVGLDGTILHYDGAEWTPMESPTDEILAAVDGTSSDDVYAAGANGTILHYNGTAWSVVASGTTELLQSVCADCGPAFAGTNGIVLRRTNGGWSRTRIDGSPWLYAIARGDDAEWVAGAAAIFRYDGALWSNMNRGTVPMLRSVALSETDAVMSAGDNGKVLLDGPDHWVMDDAGALQRLNVVFTASNGDIYAAGTNRIFRNADGIWATENADLTEYFDMSEGNGIMFAVGSLGAIRFRVNDTWFLVKNVAAELHAASMTDSVGYFAGADGIIVEYFRTDLINTVYSKYGVTFWDILQVDVPGFSIIAVGADGASVGRTRPVDPLVDPEWIDIPTNVPATLYALAPGPGGNLYAAGDNGTVLRLDNDQWTILPPPTTRTFRSACERNGALFLCGGNAVAGGMVFRYGPPSP